MKIVIPDDFPQVITGTKALEHLEATGEVTLYQSLPRDEQELLERVDGCDVVVNIRSSVRFPRSVLSHMSRSVKLLSCWGTGVDHVDLDAARSLGVTVSNTPAANSDAVAEHSLALMLAVARKITSLDRAVREHIWHGQRLFQCKSKTLGIVGTGIIGTKFARLARALGMEVIAWTYNPDPEKALRSGFTYVRDLDELLSKSDVVSLHLRSSESTRGMFDQAAFAKMKQGAIFVNTARGDLVDENALRAALVSGKLSGAGLDVLEKEPLSASCPLLDLDNVIITPHTGGNTEEALMAGLMLCAENVSSFARTGDVLHRVV